MQDHIVALISKYLNKTASEDEKRQLAGWLEESEENRRFYSLFAANSSLHDAISSPALNRNVEAMMARLDSRIEEAEQLRRRWPVRVAAFSFAFAAAVALFLFVFRGSPSGIVPARPHQTELAVNTTASTLRMVLEDGTSVFLAPGASLRYNVTGNKNSREAVLEGEAYFDVARDEARPFLVKTSNIGVKVLGTAFSVSSSTERTQVVLEHGSVRILSPEGNSMVTLSPNQKATFLNLTGDIHVEQIYATSFVTEKFNLVDMHEVTVDEILRNISDLYGVRISCSGGTDGKLYNLAFLKSDSLQDVLSIVEYLTGAECEIINHNK